MGYSKSMEAFLILMKDALIIDFKQMNVLYLQLHF